MQSVLIVWKRLLEQSYTVLKDTCNKKIISIFLNRILYSFYTPINSFFLFFIFFGDSL